MTRAPSLVRPAAVAGYFYPDDPVELVALVDGMLTAALAAQQSVDDVAPPVALVVPHAGYVYSGPIAASAYARLVRWRGLIERVVVVGPPHRVAVSGLALSSAQRWETPIGPVAIDRPACELLLLRDGVFVDDRAHAAEHSIEVHLPFLQRALGTRWRLVPVVAGGAATVDLADGLSPLWGAPSTVVIVSTDLSHYHSQREAQSIDRRTASAVVAGDWEQLDGNRACGAAGLRAALELARRRDERVELLDLRTSGDTAGPNDRVVGYGSFIVQ